MRWLDNFADPETARQLYSGAFPLVDITVIPDDDIMQHRSMAALTLVQKHIRQRDMAQLLDKLTHLLLLEQMSGQQITVLVNYIGSGRRCRGYSDTLVRTGGACRSMEDY
ncbi:Rpn family recombination-promoting nuclease/putative transposase [Klebsiella variicola subsp. variicola]|nr:Rpn family recombination-promoting nuclease/putative transposase [Klebsiella variicola subsp. variicola]